MSPEKDFGERVRTLRETRKWSQDRLAEVTGLHRTYISGIERGIRNPTLKIVWKLAAALQVAPAELLPKEVPK